MKLYAGILNEKKMSEKERKAFWCWQHQRGRCYNEKDKRYKNYGAKGIKVEYSSREFIGWFLEKTKHIKEWNTKKREWSVGRIDHSKNYTLDNIRVEKLSDNSSEMNSRTKWKKSKPVVVFYSGKFLYKCESIIEAQRQTGVFRRVIRNIADNKSRDYSRKHKYTFEWSSEKGELR